jgi:uncharacterized protein
MRYNVAQLLKSHPGARRQYDLDEEISDLDPDLDPVGPLEGSVTLMRTSQGILVTGKAQTRLNTTCKRCLQPCSVVVELFLEEEFFPVEPIGDAPLDEVPIDDLEESVMIDDHHILDLGEVVRQGLWLAAPQAALCRPDCAGLCPRCGGDRNLGECECDQAPIDPRWAVLQSLLGDETDSQERSD